mgnify:CR=1 FL=1
MNPRDTRLFAQVRESYELRQEQSNCVRTADAIVKHWFFIMKEVQTYSTAEDRLYTDVRTIIEEARLNAIRSVDFSRVVMYWKTGRRVFEEEQNGADRADYGTYLIERLASRLEPSVI